ncbi:serine/threonine protein kinase [Trichophyton tonsurans CBS 112818]|uniref:Serine/threonine protein kinase n=1 Tax=Trichophyton tonsurans (strain CBS 112818) TaxID=647933 RepID=F2RNG3_TRIT1|nr:serine/threonine protein kinase [Trichophyton tonsurans CBS 112818]
MPGLNFTYEYFCDFVPILTRASSSPANTGNLNPLIHKVLTHYSGSTIYGVGGHSVLISISEDLALKVSYRAGGEHIRHEQSIFKLLQAELCPYIARSYLSALDIILMELGREINHIMKWMQQLCEAAVASENIRYTYGDINPRDILFNDQDNVRLVNFNHILKIEEQVEVGKEPYVRYYGAHYRIAGSYTEQFALGSVLWSLTRGKELYSAIGGAEQVNRLS